MRDYKASYDTTAKVISAVVCLMLVAIVAVLHVVIVEVLCPLLILVTYAYSPRGYAIEGGAIVIKRLAGNIRIPLADVREARAGTENDFRGTIRVAGNGGLFGYFGLFRTATLGKCSWYVTNRARTVIVRTDSKTFVLSPDEREDFLSQVGVRPGGTPTANPDTSYRSRTGIIVGVGIGIVALVFLALALLYSPGVPGYSVTADSLTIHDRFYPVTLKLGSIDIPGVRVVDLSQDAEWRPTLRTNGFANAHYQSGWFRVANGNTVRLYRAGGSRLVLIPLRDGHYVLYQAEDPTAFIGELKQAAAAGSHPE